MHAVDTELVAAQFSNAAETYDTWAEPQKIVASKLAAFLPKEANRIVDIGCGTGLVALELRKHYPQAQITGVDPAVGMIAHCEKRFANDKNSKWVVATAEIFCKPSSFDLMVSSNSFHWVSDMRKALANIKKSLVPSGHFVVAASLSGTLKELYESYLAAIGTHICYANLLTGDEYASLFLEAGLSIKAFSVEDLQVCAQSPMDVINFLRGVGGAAPGISAKTPLTDEQLQTLIDYYASHFAIEGGVSVTYQYLYARVEA
jgi:malonyl-CoA O-methyltransferase